MKRTALLAAVVACVAWYAAAQEWTAPGQGVRQLATQRVAFSYAEAMFKDVGLSEEQVKKINELAEARNKAMQDFQKANADKMKEIQTAMMEASKNKDEDGVRRAREDMQKLYAPMSELQKKTQEDIMSVLTAEQKAKWQEAQDVNRVIWRFWAAKLTEEQKAKIKTLVAEAMLGVDREDRKALSEATAKASAQVEKEVLTDEQREAMKKAQENPYRMMVVPASGPAAGGSGAPGAPGAGVERIIITPVEGKTVEVKTVEVKESVWVVEPK
jgi:Spy/CpxP family protein refolding chaperone